MRARTVLAPLAVAMAIAVPALSGCGSDGDASATTSDSGGGIRQFVKDIGAELNDYWSSEWGSGWKPAIIRTPETGADTACGRIDAAETGPAYCDADRTMVLPIAFFRDQIIGATDSGRNDAAVAAVVGHEFGHHLQSLGGTAEAVAQEQADNPDIANLLSVTNELHADCIMGIWLSSVDDENRLETGDLEEVFRALDTIGDDKLSAAAGVTADAATFDHGTSAQREDWFATGYKTQDIEACNKVIDDLGDGTLADQLQAGADAANAQTAP